MVWCLPSGTAFWVLVDLPSESFHVEGLCAFDVVGRYLEMYYFTGHSYSSIGENSPVISARYTFFPWCRRSGSARVSSRPPGGGKFTALLFQEVVSGTLFPKDKFQEASFSKGGF